MREVAESFSEKQLGVESESNIEKKSEQESFQTLSPEEQVDLIYRVQSLVAKRRDLTRQYAPESLPVGDTEQVGALFGESEPAIEKSTEAPSRRQRIRARKLPGGGYIPTVLSREDREQSIETDPVQKSRLQTAEQRRTQKLAEVKKELADLGTRPGLSEAYAKEVSKLYIYAHMMQEADELQGELADIDAEIASYRRDSREGVTGDLTGRERELVALLEEEHAQVTKKLKALEVAKNIGPFLMRIREVSEYGSAYQRGQMIEIPSVKRIVDEGLQNMMNHQPFMLSGHLGSGKTAVARHIAKKWMLMNDPSLDPEKDYDTVEPEFFSGAEEASVYDLIGKLKLGTKQLNIEEIRQLVEEEVVMREQQGYAVDQEAILTRLLTIQAQGGNTETFFAYGPLGRAIKRNVPIIIDEINAIPPEILKRLNDLMTKRPGEKVRLQENGEEEFVVGNGFGMLSTLNEGTQYQGIKELSAEQINRWGQKREVDYPSVDESFDLILTPLLRKDRPRIVSHFPIEEYGRLVDLAMVVREVQKNFSGQTEGVRYMTRDATGRMDTGTLRKNVISTRDLMRKIIEFWRNGGFKEPLENIIARNVLGSMSKSTQDDQQFMAELFIRRGFFKGWNAKKFAEYGIHSLNDQNINTLLAQVDTDEYRVANADVDAVVESARERADHIKRAMLIGNENL